MKSETSVHIIWGTLVEAYHNLLELVVVNLLWGVFTILIVTAPPAIAGLYYATNQLVHEHPFTWRTFFEGFRNYFWQSWLWTIVNLLVYLTLFANHQFYAQFQTNWSTWVQGIFLGLGLLWLLLQVYTFPLLLEQEDQRIRTALRNSLVIYLKRPGASLSLILVLILLAVISTLIQAPWFIITGSLCAFIANRCTVIILDDLLSEKPARK